MREEVNPVAKGAVVLVTIYVFISEIYWLAKTSSGLTGPNGLDLWIPLIFRGLLFFALILSLLGRIAEYYGLGHEGMIADDIKFHFPRQALVFILTIFMIIKILSALF